MSGRITTWPAYQSVLSGHTAAVNCAAFSPDGKHIVSGSEDKTVRVWHAGHWKLHSVRPFEEHSETVTCVAFSPRWQTYRFPADNTILIWDVSLGKSDSALLSLEGHAGRVTSVAFSPDGKQIASGSWDRTIRIWDYERGTILSNLKNHPYCVSRVVLYS